VAAPKPQGKAEGAGSTRMRRSIALLFLLLIIVTPKVTGQESEPATWFKSDRTAPPYRDVQISIEAVFMDARSDGLPTALLMDKLREGAKKSVPAERLVEGLRAELGRLRAVHAMLDRQRVSVEDPRYLEEASKALSIALLGGVPVQTMETLFEMSLGTARGPRDIIATVTTLFQLREGSRISDEALLNLGKAMVGSALPTAAFRSIPSFFVKAAARGVRETDIIARIMIPVLESGGGLVKMEEELRRLADRSGHQ
jgi:hypothetical protein